MPFSVAACIFLFAVCHGYMREALQNRVASSSTKAIPPSQDPWYSAPAGFASAAPGAVLKVRVAEGNLNAVYNTSGAAYNILYRTTNSQYRPTWAVTTLISPLSPQIQSNTSQADILLSYQIPYDSADIDSSPSYALNGLAYADITNALAQGWYVNVPDYEGPTAAFTAGVLSGHATLDSIRAALKFGLSPQTRYAMW
jgi:hypothetical protein